MMVKVLYCIYTPLPKEQRVGLRDAAHNSRIRVVFWMLVFLLSVLLPALVARGENPDTLWQKAVTLAAGNADLFPGTIIQLENVQMEDGTKLQDSETTLKLYNDDGEVGVEVVTAVMNGKDVTKKARRNLARSESEINHTVEHPFMAEAQANISHTPTNMNETIGGRKCVKYSFTYADEESKWEGETWIEKDTAIPVQTKASLVSVPLVENGVIINTLHTLTEYGHGPGNRWFPERLVIELNIEFENGGQGGKRSGDSGPQNGTVTQEHVFKNFWRLD